MINLAQKGTLKNVYVQDVQYKTNKRFQYIQSFTGIWLFFLALSKHLYVVYHMFEFQMIAPYQFTEISIYIYFFEFKIPSKYVQDHIKSLITILI